MAEPLTRTLFDDAPLSAAKNPDPTAYGIGHAAKDDVVVGRTVTVNRPRLELYAFWRDFRNLPTFMENISSIAVIDAQHSHWIVAAPGGKTVEWDAEIEEERLGELIAWTSSHSADLRNAGRVEFRDHPAGRGTEVTATIIYHPPGGALGTLVAKLFQKEPKIQTRQDLRRFKQLMETGEVATACAH